MQLMFSRLVVENLRRNLVTSPFGTSRIGFVESEFRSSPLALAVLSLLHAAPLHPYGMQRLLKLWGKDHVINVGQRANLYKTIKRLDQAGLIAVRQTERDQQYPERTVYELTEAGRQAAADWLTDMLARPRNEYPQFPAALSFVMLLSPAEAAATLEQRAMALRGELAALDADLDETAGLPRVVLMDDEYRRAMVTAELAWLDGVIADLRSGSLTWSYELLASLALPLQPDGQIITPPLD
jgi:DNA-binding PadR family transcriptional regulator